MPKRYFLFITDYLTPKLAWGLSYDGAIDSLINLQNRTLRKIAKIIEKL